MTVKTALQALRKKAGWKSARAFAEAHGWPVRTYTHYEQGDRDMNLQVAWEIADALGCTLDELAGRTFEPASVFPDYDALDPTGREKVRSYAHDIRPSYESE